MLKLVKLGVYEKFVYKTFVPNDLVSEIFEVEIVNFIPKLMFERLSALSRNF